MALYRTLAPVIYEVEDNRVVHVTTAGKIIDLTPEQAALLGGSVVYVGSEPTAATPTATILVYEARAVFPVVGYRFHLYLDEEGSKLYRWNEATLDYVAL
jgi:hypothetical protein